MLYPFARLYGGSWFLTTLAIIYAMVAITWRCCHRSTLRFIGLSVFYLLLFFLADQGGLSCMKRLGNVLEMFPYFLFGLILRHFKWHQNYKISLLCGFFFLLVVFLSGDIRTNGMGFYWVPKDWQTVLGTPRLMFCFFARPFVGIAGSIFLLGMIYRSLARFPVLGRLSVLGTTTLGVYVMHEWPIVQVHQHCDFKTLCSMWQWPITLIVFLLCHYITQTIKAHKKLKFLFFGDEKWVSGVLKYGQRK